MRTTPEAISPAQEAWFDYRKDYGSWHQPELSQVHQHFIAGYEAAEAARAAAIEASAAFLAEAIADPEGQRLATAAANLATTWGKEWGVQWGDGAFTHCDDEESARELRRGPGVVAIISRVVGPWKEDRP